MKLLIRNACVQYGSDTIFEHADFEIHNNEKIAVVGRNGSGKTTLLKLIAGEIQPENPSSDESFCFSIAGNTSIGYLNQISFSDETASVEDELKKVFVRHISCQEKMNAIEKQLNDLDDAADFHIRDSLLNSYDNLQKEFAAIDGYSWEREMHIAFQKFGFDPQDIKRPIGNFSGGQQTKIAFVKLLLSKPDILLLDEPTNHLDLETIEWLEGYLKNYKKAVVIVSHDRTFIDNIAEITYEIEYTNIKRYPGNYSTYARLKEEAYTKQEKDYEAQQKEIKRLTEWVEMWKNTPTKVSSARSKLKTIEHMVKIEKPVRFDCSVFKAHFSPRIESYNEVLNTKSLVVGYDRPLLNISLSLKKGERMAVTGANGIGKSTLLKTITGEIPKISGVLTIGTNVEIGYFDQQRAVINGINPEETILENFWNTFPALKNEEVRSALGAFMFSQEEVEKKISMLSGGEKVRLALCKIFYTRPNFLILDEPTNHMDILGKEALEKMLTNYQGSVLFISHDRFFIKKVATSVLDISEYAIGKSDNENIGVNRDKNLFTPLAGNNPKEKNEVKNPGKIRSRLEAKIKKAEQKFSENEAICLELKSEMESESVASDYEKLLELQNELNRHSSLQDLILEEIMAAENELDMLNQLNK